MKTRVLIFSILAGLLSSSAHAQGLLNLTRSTADYTQNIPLTVSLKLSGGYDSMEYSDPLLSERNYDSYFMQAGLGLIYAKSDAVTQWSIGLDLGATRYFEDDWRGDDLYYNARLGFDVSHQVSRRLRLSNSFFIAYEMEPDYNTGYTSGRRLGQYLYGHENVSVAYAWSERFSTTTSYTLQGIYYTEDDDNFYGGQDDRLTHMFRQELSYQLTRRTSLNFEYRYAYTNYDRGAAPGSTDPDYQSHYALVGVDHAWSNRTNVHVRVGAEWYQSDRHDNVNPYLEAGFDYKLTKRSNLHWYAFVGSDGSDLGYYDQRISYRTGLSLSHAFTERFSVNAGIHYAYSDFEGNDLISDAEEHLINASLGFNYNFYRNLSLQGSYSYTTISSDESIREYDRHRVDLGLNATF